MTVPILMPSIGPGTETARLSRWLVDEGARIAPGDVIAEIETDTATMEIEASQSGTLYRRIVQEGPAEIASGTPIADVEPDAAPFEAAAASTEVTTSPPDTSRSAQPLAETKAMPQQSGMPPPERHPVSPAARAMAREAEIDLATIAGSGPGGRILKADIEAQIGKLQSAPPPGPDAARGADKAPAATTLANEAIPPATQPLTTSDATPAGGPAGLTSHSPALATPHLVMVVDCRIDELLRTRDRINLTAPPREGQPREKTLAAFYIRAAHLALALLDDPFASNGSHTAGGRSFQTHSSLTYARMTAAGLNKRPFTEPELRDIDAIAAALASGNPSSDRDSPGLGLHDTAGGNGMSGPKMSLLDLGTFRIQRAQGMIANDDDLLLAIGASERRPTASGERISIATIVTATLTIDAQRIDPAAAAASLEQFRALLEAPRSLIIDPASVHEGHR